MKSSPTIWHLLHNVKSTVKISSICVAFLKNMNFTNLCNRVFLVLWGSLYFKHFSGASCGQWQSWALRRCFDWAGRPLPKWIPGIHLGRLGWFMAAIYNRLVPGIEKYHEFIYKKYPSFQQISPFQQKDQKISSGHVTYLAPCHWFKLSSHEE